MRKRRARQEASIETGSFADISFLLIIFFILTTTLSKPLGRLVEAPSAAPPETQKASAEDKTPQVRIMSDRLLYGLGAAEGEEVSLPALRGELQKQNFAAKKPDERMVVVEVADDVPWDRYFKVVTSVAEAGGVVALVEEEGK